MSTDLTFSIPAADRLCAAVQEIVAEFGGAHEFFGTLTDHCPQFADGFAKDDWSLRSMLSQCLEDLDFREKILSGISTGSDREFLEQFLEGWDIWRRLEPRDHRWLTLTLTGAPIDELLSAIPHRLNEFFRCTSAVQLDSYFEDLRVKSAIQLAFPNKQLGGDHVLLLSAPLSGYIESMRLVLHSLALNRTELSLFKLPKDNKIIPRIIQELDELKEVVEKLQKQFRSV